MKTRTGQRSISQRIDSAFFHTARDLGPWIVPLAPAAVFGYAFYDAISERVGVMALPAGIAAGLGMEIAGVVSFHTAVMMYSVNRKGRAAIAASLGLLYVILGIVGVWTLEGDSGFRAVGTIAFLLAPTVYLARALVRDLDLATDEKTAKQKQVDDWRQDEIQHKREMELRRLEIERETKLAKIEANKEARIATVQAPLVREQPADDSEQSPEYDEHLRIVRERAGDDTFKPTDVQEWTERGRTAAYDLLRYGQEAGIVHQVGRGRYEMNGKK